MLPKIDTPTFTLVVPSTQKKVKYRPYVVKEEKILLMAAESKSEADIIDAMKRLITNCTFDALTIDDLTMYDLEYIFLQLRIKSVGETSTIQLKCTEGHATPVDVDLDKVELFWQDDEHATEKTIMLDKNLGVKLSHIPATTTETLQNQVNAADQIVNLIGACIKEVFNADNVWTKADFSEDDIAEFVEQFTNKQLDAIQQFILSQPILKETVKWTCPTCKKESSFEVKGLQNFF
jgi:hypothetical protein|tara:strand:+ start:10057 stop:10761 length:705 start_codon:yes stop_codon:yes gene_type:complete